MNDKENTIKLFSDPVKVQRKAYKFLGKNAIVYLSTRKDKKYMIFDPIHNKWVHFGQMGYEDYTKHKNATRRRNYLSRATHIRGYWENSKYSPNNLSINLLW